MLNSVTFCLFLFFAVLAYVSFHFSHTVYRDYFAPLGIFLGVNLLSLSLYHLKLIPLNNLSPQVYGVTAASFFSFTFGSFLASPSVFLKIKTMPEYNPICKSTSSQVGLNVFFYLTATLATLGWSILLIKYLSGHTLQQLYSLQGHFQSQKYIGYLNLLGILVAPIFLLIKLTKKRVSTLLSICFLISSIFGLLLAGIKTYIIFSIVVLFLAGAIVKPGRVRLKHLIIIAIVVIVFIALYNQFIDIFVDREFTASKFPKALSFLQSPYLYIVGPWPAMSAIMEKPPEQPHWGYLTFHFVWKILGEGLRIIPSVPEIEPGVDIGSTSNFNVYPMIGGLHWDFGPLGSILGCFLFGLVSTFLYILARKSGNWIIILLSSVFAYGLFISFFLYYYRFNLFFLMLYVAGFGYLSRNATPRLSKAIKVALSSR